MESLRSFEGQIVPLYETQDSNHCLPREYNSSICSILAGLLNLDLNNKSADIACVRRIIGAFLDRNINHSFRCDASSLSTYSGIRVFARNINRHDLSVQSDI